MKSTVKFYCIFTYVFNRKTYEERIDMEGVTYITEDDIEDTCKYMREKNHRNYTDIICLVDDNANTIWCK